MCIRDSIGGVVVGRVADITLDPKTYLPRVELDIDERYNHIPVSYTHLDVYKRQILAEFTRRKRIHFAHVRNIKLMQDKDFYECAHPSEYGSLDMYKVMQALYDNG